MPRGKQLSPKTRGKIEALHLVGHSVRQIAVFVRRSRNSVHQCLQRLSHGSSDYEKRYGRGKTTTIREDHRLKRMALQNRRAQSRLLSYNSEHFRLRPELEPHVSHKTKAYLPYIVYHIVDQCMTLLVRLVGARAVAAARRDHETFEILRVS